MSEPNDDAIRTTEAPVADVEGLDDKELQRLAVEAERWPVLAPVLETYFVTGREISFLAKYEQLGESSAEFTGLVADLDDAVRHYKDSTAVVNHILGTNREPSEMRQLLSALRDQITEQGEYSVEARENARAEEEAQRLEPDDMLRSWALRPVRLWGPLRRYQVPIAWFLAGGFALMLVGRILAIIPWPHWMAWFPVTFIALGFAIFGVTAFVMFTLRRNLVHPDGESGEEMASTAPEKKGRRRLSI